MLVFKFF